MSVIDYSDFAPSSGGGSAVPINAPQMFYVEDTDGLYVVDGQTYLRSGLLMTGADIDN